MDKPQTLRECYEEEKRSGLLKLYPRRTFEENKAFIEARTAALKKSCEEKCAEAEGQWERFLERQKKAEEKLHLFRERLNLLRVLMKKNRA